TVLLTKAREFSLQQAVSNVQFIADLWTRFQVREFLALDPSTDEWKAFCDTFVQVDRPAFTRFLDTNPKAPNRFICFYQNAMEEVQNSKIQSRAPIKMVHCIEGDPAEYFDTSKDGTGIYARGKSNR